MEDYVNDITAERVKSVIDGYGTSTRSAAKNTKAVEGTGGDFVTMNWGNHIYRR